LTRANHATSLQKKRLPSLKGKEKRTYRRGHRGSTSALGAQIERSVGQVTENGWEEVGETCVEGIVEGRERTEVMTLEEDLGLERSI